MDEIEQCLLRVATRFDLAAARLPPGSVGSAAARLRSDRDDQGHAVACLAIVVEPFSVFAEVEEWTLCCTPAGPGQVRIEAHGPWEETNDDVVDIERVEATTDAWMRRIVDQLG